MMLWGNWINKDTASNGTILGDALVIVNPFIYKGYYYDSETDWYYLKSRYYCSMLSRFINMDNTNYLVLGSVTGGNLFAYCGNTPVMMTDPSGNKPKGWQWVASTAAVIAGVALVATGVLSPLGGGLIAAGFGSIVGGFVNESNGGTFDTGYYIGGTLALNYFNKVAFEWDRAIINGLWGGLFNTIGAYVSAVSGITTELSKTMLGSQIYTYRAVAGIVAFGGEAIIQASILGVNGISKWIEVNKKEIIKVIYRIY